MSGLESSVSIRKLRDSLAGESVNTDVKQTSNVAGNQGEVDMGQISTICESMFVEALNMCGVLGGI